MAPSLPGFGFSGPTHERGWQPRRIAAAFVQLMTALGYERFAVQGGDWGSIVTANIADLEPERVVGLHLNFVTAGAIRDGSAPALTPAEEADLARLAEWRRDGTGYQEIQGTRPQTLGYALDDSPAGLCAWIVEKFRAWSDCDGDVERSFTKDQLLNNVTLYWVTGTGAIIWTHLLGDAPGRRDALPQAHRGADGHRPLSRPRSPRCPGRGSNVATT